MRIKQFNRMIVTALLSVLSLTAMAEDVHELFVNGAINADYFYTTATAGNSNEVIEGTTYPYYVEFGATTKTISGVNNPNRIIQYDARTDNTEIEFVVVNKSTGTNRNVYFTKIEQGETTCIPETLAIAKGGSNYVSEARTSTSTKNRSFYFSVDNITDVHIVAIKVTEKGNPIPVAGEAGYSFSFDKERLIAQTNAASYIDGMKLVLNATYAALTNTNAYMPIRNDGQMIKFYVPTNVKLTLGVYSAGASDCPFYVYPTYGTRTDAANKNIAVAGQEYEYVLEGGKNWFIYTGIGKTVNFSSISFSALDVVVDQPTNFAISEAGVVTFDEVSGHTYTLQIFDGEDIIYENKVITSGTTLTRPLKKGGAYPAKLYAVKQGTPSDPATTTWTLSDQSTPVDELPSSEYCSAEFGSGNNLAHFTWETKEDGDIVITLNDLNSNWRTPNPFGDGISSWKVGNIPASLYFTQQHTTNSNVYTLKKKAGKTVALGETISFSGRARWNVPSNTDAYEDFTGTSAFSYTYGTICQTAAKPVVNSISSAKVLDVTADGAEKYDVKISYNGDLFALETVNIGEALTFVPYLSGKTYQVTVVAKAEGQSDSEESDPYDWTPVPETYVPTASEVCSRQLTSQDGEAADTRVYMTFATVDEQIVVTLENATTNTEVSWRDKLTLAGFSMNNGVALSTFFEESVSGNTYTLALKDGKEIPHGTVIRYSGNIPWHTAEHNNCYLLAQTINYTYGSTNCATDEAPVLTASGEVMSGTSVRLTMRATDDFASTITYTISYDGAEDVVLSGANGATKTQDIEGLTQGTEYTFTIVASDGMHADTKQVVLTPSSDLLPPSNVQATIVPTGRFSARLSLYADDNVAGNITYTITGAGISDPVVAPKGTATSVDISELTENTNYSYSVVARDEAGNEAEAVVTNMTTYSSSDNLAAAKPATANAEEGAHTGDKAVDAYETTYWGNYNKVNGKGDSWLSIDLCRTANVEAINILWQHYPDYAGIGIQSSTNGTDWTERYTYTGTKFANNGRQVIYFETPVEARYLRVKNEGATQSWYMSIYNFEVFGTATGAVTLDENENNVAIIRGLDGEVADVALNRSFIADGYWYTLCLPFDLTDEQLTEAFGAGYELAKLEDSYMKTEDVLFLDFRPKKMLEAGVPYLFMPGNNVAAPIVFSNVTVSNVSTINATSVASMTGFYQPTVVDESNYFLGTNNLLKKNNNTSATKAFRAFFTLNETVPSNVQARVRVVQQEDIVTDVENLSSEDSPQKVFMNRQFFILRNGIIYNAQGQRIK